MGLLDYERRRSGAHGVEVTATGAALGTGAGIAVERVRDRYKQDKPKTLRRVAARTGPLEDAVLHARVPPAVMAAGAAAGGIGYAAQKYQDRLTATELKNTRRRAQEARNRNQDRKRGKIAARAPQEVIEMETGILAKAANYRVERHRSQAEGATLGGGLIATVATERAHAGQQRHLRAAETARRARGASAVTGTLSAAASVKGVRNSRQAFTEAATAHRAAHEYKAPEFHEKPFAEKPFVAATHTPPAKTPYVRRRPGEEDAALKRRRKNAADRFRDQALSAHEKEQNQLGREYQARQAQHTAHQAGLKADYERAQHSLRGAHEARVGREARHAGFRAAASHGTLGGLGFLGSSASAGEAAHAHFKLRAANKAAARSARAVRSRGAAALGLLGAAAVLHESKNRKPPPRIPYA